MKLMIQNFQGDHNFFYLFLAFFNLKIVNFFHPLFLLIDLIQNRVCKVKISSRLLTRKFFLPTF